MRVEILEEFLAPSGTPGMFANSKKNIFKLRRLFMAFRNSRKILTTFKKFWSV